MGFLCDGRVVVITGAGRGIGRGHALEFARQGAKVVVNDIGAELDGSGGSTGPAGEVVEEIRADLPVPSGNLIHFGRAPCPIGYRDYEGLILAASDREPAFA